jgi:GNAT superfamily N-acetyltransferase
MLTLRPPRVDEAVALTELCLRSKAVWGYDAAFMAACRGELTLTPAIIASSCLMVAEDDHSVVGVAQVAVDGPTAALDKLFVEPGRRRSGAGRTLFAWAREAARHAGARVMVIEADPGAAGFYRRMGAVDDGTVPSGSIPGRVLPRLVVTLSGT